MGALDNNLGIKADMTENFCEWLDGVLAQGLPDEAAAVCFNIYEDGGDDWSIQLIAAAYFDEDDEDWACDEAFTTGEDMFRWQERAKWSKALETAKKLISDYLNNGRYAEMLKQYEAVACGFVDGDIQILYKN